MATVMVLAAGHGTRLRPLTEERPKALVPVGDLPVIAHLIDKLRAQLGDVRILANAHHRAAELVTFLHGYDPALRVLVESKILGTAGGLRGALEHLVEGPLLVVNSDIISTPNYRELLRNVADEAVVLCVVRKPAGQGPLGTDSEGRVVRLRHEQFGAEAFGGDYLGVAALGARVVPRLPLLGCFVGDFLLPMLRAGTSIETVSIENDWIDVGTLAEYARANQSWLRQRALDTWVGPDCTVPKSIKLEASIVGQGARISGSGLVRRVIAWPFAQLEAPMQDSVVTSSGRVIPIPTQTD